jgi:MFS family permease
MNAQGVAVEQRMGKSIMSGLHGMWSVGGLIGSAIGAAAAYRNIDARVHLGVMAVVLAVAALLASFRLLPSRPAARDKPPRFAFPTGPVLGIALVGFCAVFVEGSTADWCAVYLRQVTDAGAGLAAASYTLFALTMAAGRISGDVVVRRFGAVRTVRASGVVAVLGGVLVVLARAPAVAMIGFALCGLGVAVVVPLAFAAAGHAGPHSAHAIAGVATVSYGAGLAAPAAVGGIASLTSLPGSFAVITALAAMISIGAGRLRPADAIRRV